MTEPSDVPEIDVHQLAQLRQQGGHVLDVRQPDEYAEAHLPDAVLIPLDELPDRVDDVPAGGDAPLTVICRSGSRSRVAAEFLRARGIESHNLAGGMVAWIEAGFEVERGGT